MLFIAMTGRGRYAKPNIDESTPFRMKYTYFAKFTAAFFFGLAALLSLAVASAPALAKKKDKLDQNLAAPISNLSALVDPDPSHDPDNVLVLDLSNGSRVLIRLMPKWAPGHVDRIKTLVKEGFYNGIIFHRVIDGFMAQTGDPTGTGQGGSKLPDLKAEFNHIPHVRGSLSMARTSDPDSANSQFFIVFYPRFALDRKYTNLGRVISGMDGVDAIIRGEPPEKPTKILQASMASDQKSAPIIAVQPVIKQPSILDLNTSKSN